MYKPQTMVTHDGTISLTDGAGPNFSALLVALFVARRTRDGWWRGDEEVIAIILVVGRSTVVCSLLG